MCVEINDMNESSAFCFGDERKKAFVFVWWNKRFCFFLIGHFLVLGFICFGLNVVKIGICYNVNNWNE